jgi:hypothetical protein
MSDVLNTFFTSAPVFGIFETEGKALTEFQNLVSDIAENYDSYALFDTLEPDSYASLVRLPNYDSETFLFMIEREVPDEYLGQLLNRVSESIAQCPGIHPYSKVIFHGVHGEKLAERMQQMAYSLFSNCVSFTFTPQTT